MPWTELRYPPAMERLPPRVREKAIAIANALLEEGWEEGAAIRIGIAKAKEWAKRRGSLWESLLSGGHSLEVGEPHAGYAVRGRTPVAARRERAA